MARPSGRKTSQFKLPQGQPRPSMPSAENTFIQGLKTEFTGLNFPESACTATENCVFTRVGNVFRRPGIDLETMGNVAIGGLNRANSAISTFLWNNAGGDGNSVLYCYQIGGTIFFAQVSGNNNTGPLSASQLASNIALSSFTAIGGSFDATLECQYASGNGYLFIFHPSCDPIYCTFASSTVTAAPITLQIRDFAGIPDNLTLNQRPLTLSAEHQYNLINQGWASGSAWSCTSQTGTFTIATGSHVITITTQTASTGISNGDSVSITLQGNTVLETLYGTVTAFSSGVSITVNVTSFSGSLSGTVNLGNGHGGTFLATVTKINTGFINTWLTAEGNYPSNSDIWYLYKDTSDVFNPATTQPNVAALFGQSPQGHFVLPAFNQDRTLLSTVAGLTPVTTAVRPKTGAWFQGRIWYAGVDASFVPSGDAPFSTWTENIYFSQIVSSTSDFGTCYQVNDPTSETLNALLPTDGGVIQIQGAGSIYKLFPVQNGLIVFASEGIWFITGNSGLGFTADNFSVTKVSGYHNISGTSYVNVEGWPIFWNADGIYSVQPGQSYTSGQTALEVKNLTLETIKTAYQAIPLSSKKYARGSYNHVTGELRWLYLSTEATSITNRYEFDSVLNMLTYTGAFYTWSLPTNVNVHCHAIDYIEGPGGISVKPPLFKYLISQGTAPLYNILFGEENNTSTYTDYPSLTTGISFTSFFETGYRLKGQAWRKFQPQYVFIYSEVPTSQYTIQGVWNYAISSASGKYSALQVINNNTPLYGKNYRRLRIPGNGYILQFLISSVQGQPFNISGWAVLDTTDIGT